MTVKEAYEFVTELTEGPLAETHEDLVLELYDAFLNAKFPANVFTGAFDALDDKQKFSLMIAGLKVQATQPAVKTEEEADPKTETKPQSKKAKANA